MKHFKCAVITGASSGIGLELARLLAKRCDVLVLVARRAERLKLVAAELGASCRIEVIIQDLEVVGGAEALWQKLAQANLHADLFVNNAGFGLFGESLETPLEREQAMIQLNITALFTLTKLAAKQMTEHGGGVVLNLASVAAFQAGPRMAVYFASKAFVLHYSEALDQELHGRNVRVLALCPGNTGSEFHQVAGTTRVKSMQRATQMDTPTVARIALRQIDQGRRICVPGVLNKVMVVFSQLMPRCLVTKISEAVLRIG
jgi:short-subunit dehydrogenase